MRERPILFTAPMVRAIQAGTKTMTRRVVRGQTSLAPGATSFDLSGRHGWCANDAAVVDGWREMLQCPYGVPGDRLWVKETWAPHADEERHYDKRVPWSASLFYAADGFFKQGDTDAGSYVLDEDRRVSRWRPSIFMTRWASRITLEIADVRVERPQSITEEDARAEGIEAAYPLAPMMSNPRTLFASLWDSINGKRAPWSANPWVWVISFRRLP